MRDVRSIFNVSCACLISLYHSTDGKVSSHVLRPAIVWFLNVCITHSSIFTWCLCGSTIFILMFSSFRYFLTSLEATFSIMF